MPGFAGCSCRLNLASRAVCFITTAIEHRQWRVNPSVCADAHCEAEAVERAGGAGGGGGADTGTLACAKTSGVEQGDTWLFHRTVL